MRDNIMTIKEKNKELEVQILHLKSLNQFLTRKFEQQSELLKEIPELKGEVEVLKTENRHLKNEKEILERELDAYRNGEVNNIA